MPTTIEKVLMLQDLEIFSFTSTEDLAQLAPVCHEFIVEADEILFRAGEVCSKLYLLIEGQVRLQEEGQSVVVERRALDFWSFFAQSTHQVTGRTLERCTLLVVSQEDLADLLTADPEFCWAILKYLARLGRTLATGRMEPS